MIASAKRYLTVFAATAVLALGLYGCGGGGGEGPMTDGGLMMPEDVDLSSVTPGYMAGAGTVQVAAGQSVNHGDVEFTCAAGGADCTVSVEVGADGTVSATSTGGMVTAMNSDAYNTRITPMAVNLSPVTAGYMAGPALFRWLRASRSFAAMSSSPARPAVPTARSRWRWVPTAR